MMPSLKRATHPVCIIGRIGEEEASLQRAIEQGDSGPKKSQDTAPINATGGGRKETAREESKREEADRVARYVVD